MVLADSFYYQPVQIDTINTRVNADLFAKEGDANGRGMVVQITENGIIKDTTGITLRLQWSHISVGTSGFTDFEVVDATKGLYKLVYPTSMLHRGRVEAFIRITDNGILSGTRNLLITVERMVGSDETIEASDDFSALQTALTRLSAWEATISGKVDTWEADMEATKQLYIDTLVATEAGYPQELVSLQGQLAETDSSVGAVNSRIDNLTIPLSPENANIEVTESHTSTVKSKSFPTLKERLEDDERELKDSDKFFRNVLGMNDNLFKTNDVLNAYIDANYTIVESASDMVAFAKVMPNTHYNFSVAKKTNTNMRIILCDQRPKNGIQGRLVVTTLPINVGSVDLDFYTEENDLYLAFKFFTTGANKYTTEEILGSINVSAIETLDRKLENLQSEIIETVKNNYTSPFMVLRSTFDTFENHTIDGTYLLSSPSPTRMVNTEPLINKSKYTLTPNDGYKFRVLLYDEEKTPVSLSGWGTETVTLEANVYHSIVVAFIDDSPIVNSDLYDAFNENQIAVETVDWIVEWNADVKPYVDASCSYGINAFGEKNHYNKFCMLVSTDLHRDDNRLSSAVEYLNAIDSIDAGCCLGDMQASNYADNDGTWYTSIVNQSEKPFYTVIGNHDIGNTNLTSKSATTSQAFEKFIQPTLSKVGLPDLNKTYYSVDNIEHKITTVVLNAYDTPDTLLDNDTFSVNKKVEAYSQAQLDWLIGTLNDVPSDWTVVVLTHNFYDEANPIECNFTTPGKNIGENSSSYGAVNIIPDIVQAWIEGTPINETYEPKSEYSQYLNDLQVNADFSTRGTGNFACYISGHVHFDVISKCTKYPNQLICTFLSSSSDDWQNFASDLPKVEGTKTIDTLTTIAIDTELRLINLVRIGSNVTRRMVKRDMISLSY